MSDHLLVSSTWLSLGTKHSTRCLPSNLVLSWHPPDAGQDASAPRANLSPPSLPRMQFDNTTPKHLSGTCLASALVQVFLSFI